MFQRNFIGIGVDIGGTNIRIGAVNRCGLMLPVQIYPTRCANTPAMLVQLLKDSVAALAQHLDIIPDAIGVGIPGPYNVNSGIVTALPNLPGWENFPIRQELFRAFSSKNVQILNDADAAGYGEYCFGSEKLQKNFVLLSLGTGLGSSVFINGDAYVGPGGFSPEIGHLPISLRGPKCGCGARGHVESYLSSYRLADWIINQIRLGRTTELPAESYNFGTVHFESLIQCANRGDHLARQAKNRYGRFLGRVLALVANLFNVKLIILTGGIANAWDAFRDVSILELRKCAFPQQSQMDVIQSSIGDRAGVLGAASYAIRSSQCDNFPFS